jgi:hypothetical protein
MTVQPATKADLPRIDEVRHGTAENRVTDPSLVTDAFDMRGQAVFPLWL